ncbi:hypothetical protein PILCRDRAFT_824303 [Piloderma croceum F 1598]|uniref:Uncharacterized protein n=1 Tax=Piloderma croceum (strain F 1598) TaxID=765440 RepID=A0A0C3BM81_PILCF|nr:hypothetical protein PILCRDRAFT_824303 [Piloderma croceum F 1598]
MAIKLDLTELNRMFDKPSMGRPSPQVQTPGDQAWLEQFFARVHLTESLNFRQSTLELSPSSSNSTLIDHDDAFLDYAKDPTFIEEPFFPLDTQGNPQLFSIMSERSKYFVDEISRRTEQRKALSMNTDISSCPSTPSPSSSITSNTFNPNAIAFVPSYTHPARSTPSPSSSISSTSINPNAAPFIPSYTPLVPASIPGLISEVPDDSWFPIFWEGVSTKEANAQQLHAAALVDSMEWESESLAVLSQHFCWKGAEGAADELGGVVSFARLVHDCFRATYGDWYANCLTRHIRECVVGHFKACWKSEQPQAITYANPPSISYLSSALSLTTFVGDLYAQGLLPRSSIHHCISILVAELNAIEHIHAIHLLVLHANSRLWRGKDANKAIKDFVASFTQRASCMGDDASVMGNPFKKSELRAWVKEITDMLNRWQVPRRASLDVAASKEYAAGDKIVVGLQVGQRR